MCTVAAAPTVLHKPIMAYKQVWLLTAPAPCRSSEMASINYRKTLKALQGILLAPMRSLIF